jgi:outer membrane protein assembly factor BamE (lipoprotein component of BamABCDE complex)
MRFSLQRLRAHLKGATLVAVIGLAGACAPEVATHGNLLTDREVAQIQEGVSTAEEIRQRFGTPTATATFDQDVWYYIGQRTEQTAFFEPEITQRRVLRLEFDETGRVTDIQERTLEDGVQFAFVDRETPTLGRQLGLLEQLFGNLGRFNQGGGAPPISAPVPGTPL